MNGDINGEAPKSATAVEYSIVDAPDVPVIWFDTHAVSELAEAVSSDRDDQQRPMLRDLHRRIVELRQANRIVVLETDQMYEVERRPDIVKRCVDMLIQLSQGARSSHRTVQRRQLEIGMATRLGRQSRAEIGWDTCWETNPFADHSVSFLSGNVFVQARLEPSADDLTERRRTADTIAKGWEQLRSEQLQDRRPRSQRLEDRVAVERAGHYEAIAHLVGEALRRIDNGEPFTAEEFDIQNGRVSEPLRLWQSLGGDGIVDMLDFYESGHYQDLPLIDIMSRLIAGRIVGNEPIKASDYTDIKNIAAFLPYSTHMVLDRAMIEAVNSSGLAERYRTRVLRLRELTEVLDALE